MTGIAYLALVLVGFNWAAAYILVRIDRAHPGSDGLSERAQAQIVLALIATMVGVLAANRLNLLGFTLSNDASVLLLILCLLGVSVPGLLWLVRFWRGFR